MTRELERTLAKLAHARRQRRPPDGGVIREPRPQTGLGDTSFRPVIEERLRGLEQQIAEVKLRVNGLLFLLAGSVATEAVRRIVS